MGFFRQMHFKPTLREAIDSASRMPVTKRVKPFIGAEA
jgi:hypothetical protein